MHQPGWTKKYQVVHELGRGAFGIAFLVKPRTRDRNQQACASTNDFLVLKQVSLNRLRTKQERVAAQQEVQVLQRFRHNNIVKFTESFTQGSDLCIVMEFADGGDLAARIEARKSRGPNSYFEESYVCHLFAQLAVAMRHIHSHNILHRDLKPQNVFLHGPNDVVKLGDFGVSRVLEHTNAMAQTQCGTPYFLSPEVWHGHAYDMKSDIWALGCILYELLTLQIPFKASSLPELASKIANTVPPSLPSRVTESMQNLVNNLLKKNPAERPTASQLCQDEIIVYHIDTLFSRTLDSSSGTKDEVELNQFILDSVSPQDFGVPNPIQLGRINDLNPSKVNAEASHTYNMFLENCKQANIYKQRHQEQMGIVTPTKGKNPPVSQDRAGNVSELESGKPAKPVISSKHANDIDDKIREARQVRKQFLEDYKRNLANAKRLENAHLESAPVDNEVHSSSKQNEDKQTQDNKETAHRASSEDDYVSRLGKELHEIKKEKKNLQRKNKNRGIGQSGVAWELIFTPNGQVQTEKEQKVHEQPNFSTDSTKSKHGKKNEEGHDTIPNTQHDSDSEEYLWISQDSMDLQSSGIPVGEQTTTFVDDDLSNAPYPGNPHEASSVSINNEANGSNDLSTTVPLVSTRFIVDTTMPNNLAPKAPRIETSGMVSSSSNREVDEHLPTHMETNLGICDTNSFTTGYSGNQVVSTSKIHSDAGVLSGESAELSCLVAVGGRDTHTENNQGHQCDRKLEQLPSLESRKVELYKDDHSGSPQHTTQRDRRFESSKTDEAEPITTFRHQAEEQQDVEGRETFGMLPPSTLRQVRDSSEGIELQGNVAKLPHETKESEEKQNTTQQQESNGNAILSQDSTQVLKELVNQFQQEREHFQNILNAHEERARQDKALIDQLVKLNTHALENKNTGGPVNRVDSHGMRRKLRSGRVAAEEGKPPLSSACCVIM